MSREINVSLQRICPTDFFSTQKYKQCAHPLMSDKEAKSTMVVRYSATVNHLITISDKLHRNLCDRDREEDWALLGEEIKKFLQCTPNEKRLISYGQLHKVLRGVKVSGKAILTLPEELLPKYNSGNFHILSIDLMDD